MRKIIITVIATIFMIAPFEKAKGQWQEQTVITSSDFPTVNVLTGVNAKNSFGIWRFELFGQVGQYFFQLFEESMVLEPSGGIHLPRFDHRTILDVGMCFRITDRNRIKMGWTMFWGGRLDNARTYHRADGTLYRRIYNAHLLDRLYLGYIHSINLFQRISLDLSVLYGTGTFNFGLASTNVRGTYQFINFGTRLNYEILPNLKLNVQLGYMGRHRVRYGWRSLWRITESTNNEISPILRNISGERVLTRNIINFSIGIHYHIPIFGVPQQQTAPRPPRQRALPCPPGQMRHQRSWDRPSSVFNHPSAR